MGFAAGLAAVLAAGLAVDRPGAIEGGSVT
jgi:hypothetical protein